MIYLIDVILPVFLVIGFGYLSTWRHLFSATDVEGLMRFAQNFAVPCLLFAAISKLDLSDFNAPLLLSYYLGTFSVFFLGYLGARMLFSRSVEDSISIGFCAMFPNTLLLGLSIMERAYGEASLAANFAIVSIHAPLIYSFGVISMELARTKSTHSGPGVVGKILKSLITNPLIIAVLLGFLVNISGVPVPKTVSAGVTMMAVAALPAALFGLGGVLVRYRPEGDMKAIAWVTFLSLMVHPAISFGLGKWAFQLDQAQLRSVVVTAAMAPGVNAYLFASMYGAARRVAASAVLLSTAVSILTIFFWLTILP